LRSIHQAREEFEKAYVAKALRKNGWNVSKTARQIGLSRQGLSLKLRKLGLLARDPRLRGGED
jgi:DNA-binding NtrC family response regulator